MILRGFVVLECCRGAVSAFILMETLPL